MKRPTRRPAPRFQLDGQERALLALYRTVGEPARRLAGEALIVGWHHPPEQDKAATERRFKSAGVNRLFGSLGFFGVLDQVRTGARRQTARGAR